jgi:hypothetical protein
MIHAWLDHIDGGPVIYVDGHGGPVIAVDEADMRRGGKVPATAVELVTMEDAVDALRKHPGSRGVRLLGIEQCCENACNGGACESCRCCSAGWCVTGADGLPDTPEDLARWVEAARVHNPIAAALAEALARPTAASVVERIRTDLRGLQGVTPAARRAIAQVLDRAAGVQR